MNASSRSNDPGFVPLTAYAVAVAAMAFVVLASNVLVRYPVQAEFGGADLADLLTWGAFTYPFAFLVTDLTNRRFGARAARRVVYAGFAAAIVLSMLLSSPRIAVASASAFLIGQLLDVTLFNRLRRSASWWAAPLVGTLVGSIMDTTVFFSLAFAPVFGVFEPTNPFALEPATLLGLIGVETARWVSWAIADLIVKLLFALALLVPYRLMMAAFAPPPMLAR